MADEIDLANAQSELFLSQALAARTAAPRLAPRGKCYYCETVFESEQVDKDGRPIDERGTVLADKLFCDKDCADDFTELERKRNRR